MSHLILIILLIGLLHIIHPFLQLLPYLKIWQFLRSHLNLLAGFWIPARTLETKKLTKEMEELARTEKYARRVVLLRRIPGFGARTFFLEMKV